MKFPASSCFRVYCFVFPMTIYRSLLGLIATILLSCVAKAQGLYVQPASYEMTVRAGGTYSLPLELRNNQSDITNIVNLKVVYLTQDLSGFEGLEATEVTPAILNSFHSCASWIKLPSFTHLSVAPISKVSPAISISVPAGTRGFYGAVIIVTSERARPEPGLKTVLRFVIPILLNVDGGLGHKSGQAVDAAASFFPADKSHGPGTLVACMVKNSGDALARFSGKGNLFQLIGTRKRRLMTATFDERRIIPNATVALSFKSPKLIPSGKYLFESDISMEGRKMPLFSKQIDVKGDPSVKSVAADVELGLSPDPIQFDVISGSMRGLSFKVQNTSSEPIVIDAYVSIPKPLVGGTGPFGNGDDLSIAPWCKEPITGVEIKGGQERSLRMLASVPDSALGFPFYYGQLNVTAKTPEGAFIGTGSLLIIGKNKLVNPVLSLVASGEVSVASIKPKVYSFTSSFTNNGNQDLAPEIEARITDTAGITTLMGLSVDGAPKHVLPFEAFRPSGLVDISLLKDGVYLLEVSVKSGNIAQAKTVGIRITTTGKTKSLSIVKVGKSGAGQEKKAPSGKGKTSGKGGG